MLTVRRRLLSIERPAPLPPPVFLVGTALSTGAAVTTTPAIDTSGASLLVVHTTTFGSNSPPVAVTDSKGNSYTSLPTIAGVGASFSTLFYCSTPTVGTGHTFTASGGTAFAALAVATFSGTPPATAADVSVGASGSGGTLQPGSATPSHDNEVIVTGLAFEQGVTVAIDEGFAIAAQVPNSSGLGTAIAYLVQGASGAVNPSWTGPGIGGATTMGSFQ